MKQHAWLSITDYSPPTTPKYLPKRKFMHSGPTTPRDNSFLEHSLLPSRPPPTIPAVVPSLQPAVSGHPNKRPKQASATTGSVDNHPSHSGTKTDGTWIEGQQKRSRAISSAVQNKRGLLGTPHRGHTGEIEFDEVYQVGQTEPRYTIAKYDEHWYILGCAEHGKCYATDHPIRSAVNHMVAHDLPRATYEAAIKRLGTKVLNCDKELVELNNKHLTNPPIISQLDPMPGKVYKIFVNELKAFYGIAVLSWSDSGQSSRLPNVKATSLICDIPTCYRYDKGTKAVQWSPKYSPREIYGLARKYPVILFDENLYTPQRTVRWLPLHDFQVYVSGDNVCHKETVESFISSNSNVLKLEVD
ncbi:hypothetical protein FLAG1_11935 [Fusarium langsethiae]|uniref:Uncharacterized protein n=1 Tax=Fusarium langsethiae TaxID=179993 RepID=A0A0M9ELY3_FUSLA|nr:hypothetical protein FLAG1_11935 [Fusarium langsethiae]